MSETNKGEDQGLMIGPGASAIEGLPDPAAAGERPAGPEQKKGYGKASKKRRREMVGAIGTRGRSGDDTKPAAKIRVFKLADLQVNPENPRAIDPAARKALQASLSRFGLVQPLVVNVHGGGRKIVSGHQRYELLRESGIQRAMCVVVDWPEAKAGLAAIALNNPNLSGQFTADLDRHIETLRASLAADDKALADLRIEELRGNIETAATGTIETVELRPYKKVHVLLSMPVDSFAAVQEMLTAILADNPEVEYEQSAN